MTDREKLTDEMWRNLLAAHDVASLTEALAAAERVIDGMRKLGQQTLARAEAAEQKLATTEKEANAAFCIEVQLRQAAEARCRELESWNEHLDESFEETATELAQLRERVPRALENPTTVEGLRAAVLEALRGQ